MRMGLEYNDATPSLAGPAGAPGLPEWNLPSFLSACYIRQVLVNLGHPIWVQLLSRRA
jgi:hypothetical protein